MGAIGRVKVATKEERGIKVVAKESYKELQELHAYTTNPNSILPGSSFIISYVAMHVDSDAQLQRTQHEAALSQTRMTYKPYIIQ